MTAKTTKLPIIKGHDYAITGAITGYSRRRAYEAIRERGGKVHNAVKAGTDYLVCGHWESGGAKLGEAERLGVPRITEAEFLAALDAADKGDDMSTNKDKGQDMSNKREPVNVLMTRQDLAAIKHACKVAGNAGKQRPALQRVEIYAGGGVLRIRATDSYRALKFSRPFADAPEGEGVACLISNVDALALVAAKPYGLTICASGVEALSKYDNVRRAYSAADPDTHLPDFSKLWPEGPGAAWGICIDPSYMADAMAACGAMGKGFSTSIELGPNCHSPATVTAEDGKGARLQILIMPRRANDERIKAWGNVGGTAAAVAKEHDTIEDGGEPWDVDKWAKAEGLAIKRTACAVWVMGDTKPHRDALKAHGFKWSAKRGAWWSKVA